MLQIILLCCLVSYLAGSLPFGLWVGLLWKHVDIRTLGSKNIGATNVLRVLGPGPGLTVFALDIAKGTVGVALAHQLLHEPVSFGYYILIGFLSIIGHTFSIFLRFKGGKGVATALGILLALGWQVGVIAFLLWLIVVAITRYVSLASLAAAISLPFGSYFALQGDARWWMMGLGAVMAVLVIVKHRPNIERLLAGTESKIGQRVAQTNTEVH